MGFGLRLRSVVAVLLLSLVVVGPGCRRARESGQLPAGTSLLLVTLDTTRQDFISPYGAEPAISPNLTRLASEGCIFLNAFSQLNVTNPAHVTIFTGLRAIDHRVFNNHLRLPDGLDTLPAAFRRRGFATAGFPSTRHLGQDMEWRGFDHFEPAEVDIDSRAVTDRALGWLARRPDKPFFAWVHYWDPHAPYEPPPAFASKFYRGDPFTGEKRFIDEPYFQHAKFAGPLTEWIGERRDPEFPRAMYAAEIHHVDRELDRLLRYLDETALAKTTVVMVIADHGESLTEHGIYFGHSGLYETQLRIPFIVRVPGFPSGLRPAARVGQIDVAPTVAELLGISFEHEPRGTSLVPLLRGLQSPEMPRRDSLIHEHAHNLQVAHRRDRWKLILPIAGKKKRAYLPDEPQLFDLQADPDELTNVAADHPEIVAELAEPLEPWANLGYARGDRKSRVSNEKALQRLKALGYVQ